MSAATAGRGRRRRRAPASSSPSATSSTPTPSSATRRSSAPSAVAAAAEAAGLAVERGAAGLPTAFRATAGSGSLAVALCAEYDALPDVGHACGHNVIAASSLGAAIGLAAVADELDLTVVLLGTPSEEGGGGKIDLIDAGYFDGVHAAMMVHPWPERPARGALPRRRPLRRRPTGAARRTRRPRRGRG